MTSRRKPAAHGESKGEPLTTGSGLRGIPLAREVRDALAHLLDPPYLETSPLVYLVADDAQSEGISPGRSLQRRILQAIEALRPSVNTPGRAGAAASLRHRLLYLRYVEMKDISEICAELAISQRKYYVEHVLGIKALISLLTTATPVAFRTIRQFSPILADTPQLLRGSQLPYPFIGRTNELAMLKSIYETAVAGRRGKLVVINGESGVGKSTLAQMLALYAHSRGALVLEGKYSDDTDSPHTPWADVLRAGLQFVQPEQRASYLGELAEDLSRLLPELQPTAPSSPRVPPLNREEQQANLYASIGQILATVSLSAPLVILLDNIHRAPDLKGLAHVASMLADLPVLIIGAFRQQELLRQPALAKDLGMLQQIVGFAQVSLGPFDEAETEQLLATMFGEIPAMRLSSAVYETTGGNPFFVEETIRSLVERRIVRPTFSGWECADLNAVSVPDTIIRSIEDRVAKLGVQGRSLLNYAAILGREFVPEILMQLVKLEEPAFWLEIEKALAAGILVDRSTPGKELYAFADERVQEVLHETLPDDERRQYHVRAARVIEERYGNKLDERGSELASHLAFSSTTADLEKAIGYLRAAAEHAIHSYAYSAAAGFIERALTLEQQLPKDKVRRCDLLLFLAEVLGPGGDPGRVADEIAAEALMLAEEMGDEERARQACRIGLESVIRSTSRMAPSTKRYQDWVIRCDKHAVAGTSDRLYTDVAAAWIKWQQGFLFEAKQVFVRNWALAKELGDPSSQFQIAAILLAVPPFANDYLWHQTVAEEVLQLPRENAPLRALGTALHYAGSILLQKGMRSRTENLWKEVRNIANRTRDPYLLTYAHIHEGILSLLDGNLDHAIKAGSRVIAHSDQWGMPAVGRYISAGLTVRPLLLQGAAEEALAFLQHHAAPHSIEPNRQIPELVAYESLCLLQLGRKQEAQNRFEHLLDRYQDAISSQTASANLLAMLLEASISLEDVERVGQLVRCLQGVEDLWSLSGCFSVGRLVGDGLRLMGEAEQALDCYETALQACSKLGARAEAALVQLHLAELLLDAYPNRYAETQELLDGSTIELRSLRMQPALARALHVKRRLEQVAT